MLYAFGANAKDASTPMAGLIDINGTFYGTSAFGGSSCGSVGCGTVFTITPSGTEKVLCSFKGGRRRFDALV